MNRTSQSFRCGLRSDDESRRPSPPDRPPPLRARPRYRLLALSLVAVLLPGAAFAQNPNRGDYTPRHGPDFLIGPPHVTLSLRGGMLFPRANSPLFSRAFSELSMPGDTARRFKRADLDAPSLTGELAIWTPRADITVSLGYARASKMVEYRYWADADDLPIQYWTRFAQVPLTVSLKAYLLPRGRQVGRFAYIPNRYQPYIGLAGGTVYHRYRESGDFINFTNTNLPVYNTNYESTGWSPTVQLLGGSEIGLTRRANLQVEVRYGWATGHLASEFPALAPAPASRIPSHADIDLAGLQTTIGFGWRL